MDEEEKVPTPSIQTKHKSKFFNIIDNQSPLNLKNQKGKSIMKQFDEGHI